MNASQLSAFCESVHREYNVPALVPPDPLEFVLATPEPADREIVAFIAATLALGRVAGIKQAIAWILDVVPEPARTLPALSEHEIASLCRPFCYRFFTGAHLAAFLTAIRRALIACGSLEECFAAGMCMPETSEDQPEATVGALARFVDTLHEFADGRLRDSILLADPRRGSACKRLWLFLRWMTRKDAVDPGGWTVVKPAGLLVPLDTHMLRICRALGLTRSRQASMSAAREITGRFREIAPEDPVRYDFSLTRIGIHPEGRRGIFNARIVSLEGDLTQSA